MDIEKIKQIEDKIRDLINDIEIMKNEDVEGGVQKIEDSAAEELKEKLQQIAEIIGNLED